MSSNYRLILASSSPRRQELLSQLGFEFQTFKKEVDESFSSDMEISKVAEYLAVKKNEACRQHFSNEVILTADTTVVSGENILNKPSSLVEAQEMIHSLSGKEHQVITGICISDHERSFSESVVTTVIFNHLTAGEVDHYIDRFQPFDKAGAYGIQEWIGLVGVSRIEGSYFNVMGLPTHRVYELLTKNFDLNIR